MQNNLDKYGLVKVKNPNGKFLRNIILGLCLLLMSFGGFAFGSLLPKKDNFKIVEAASGNIKQQEEKGIQLIWYDGEYIDYQLWDDPDCLDRVCTFMHNKNDRFVKNSLKRPIRWAQIDIQKSGYYDTGSNVPFVFDFDFPVFINATHSVSYGRGSKGFLGLGGSYDGNVFVIEKGTVYLGANIYWGNVSYSAGVENKGHINIEQITEKSDSFILVNGGILNICGGTGSDGHVVPDEDIVSVRFRFMDFPNNSKNNNRKNSVITVNGGTVNVNGIDPKTSQTYKSSYVEFVRNARHGNADSTSEIKDYIAGSSILAVKGTVNINYGQFRLNYGAPISVESDATLNVNGGLFENNLGGAIKGTNINVRGGTFKGNTYYSAISGTNLNITGGTFDSNTSNNKGGAILAKGRNNFISGATFTNNKAYSYGGAICFDEDDITATTKNYLGTNTYKGNDAISDKNVVGYGRDIFIKSDVTICGEQKNSSKIGDELYFQPWGYRSSMLYKYYLTITNTGSSDYDFSHNINIGIYDSTTQRKMSQSTGTLIYGSPLITVNQGTSGKVSINNVKLHFDTPSLIGPQNYESITLVQYNDSSLTNFEKLSSFYINETGYGLTINDPNIYTIKVDNAVAKVTNGDFSNFFDNIYDSFSTAEALYKKYGTTSTVRLLKDVELNRAININSNIILDGDDWEHHVLTRKINSISSNTGLDTAFNFFNVQSGTLKLVNIDFDGSNNNESSYNANKDLGSFLNISAGATVNCLYDVYFRNNYGNSAVVNAGTFAIAPNNSSAGFGFTYNDSRLKNGGAINNSGTLLADISDDGTITFANNTGANGGAIFNTGNISFITDDRDSQILFNNNLSNSLGGSIYTTKGTVSFSGVKLTNSEGAFSIVAKNCNAGASELTGSFMDARGTANVTIDGLSILSNAQDAISTTPIHMESSGTLRIINAEINTPEDQIYSEKNVYFGSSSKNGQFIQNGGHVYFFDAGCKAIIENDDYEFPNNLRLYYESSYLTEGMTVAQWPSAVSGIASTVILANTISKDNKVCITTQANNLVKTQYTTNAQAKLDYKNENGVAQTTIYGDLADLISRIDGLNNATDFTITVLKNITLSDAITIDTFNFRLKADNDITITTSLTDSAMFYFYSDVTFGGGTGMLTFDGGSTTRTSELFWVAISDGETYLTFDSNVTITGGSNSGTNSASAIYATNTQINFGGDGCKNIYIKNINVSNCSVIYSESSTLNFGEGVIFQNNKATYLINADENSTLNISNTKFLNNSTDTSNSALIKAINTATNISNTQFIDNTTKYYIIDVYGLTMADSTFSGNESNCVNIGYNGSSTNSITNTVFRENKGNIVSIGGANVTATLNNCSFIDNLPEDGNGETDTLTVSDNATVTLEQCNFKGNTVKKSSERFSGGFIVYVVGGSTVYIKEGTIFDGNSSPSGAIISVNTVSSSGSTSKCYINGTSSNPVIFKNNSTTTNTLAAVPLINASGLSSNLSLISLSYCNIENNEVPNVIYGNAATVSLTGGVNIKTKQPNVNGFWGTKYIGIFVYGSGYSSGSYALSINGVNTIDAGKGFTAINLCAPMRLMAPATTIVGNVKLGGSSSNNIDIFGNNYTQKITLSGLSNVYTEAYSKNNSDKYYVARFMVPAYASSFSDVFEVEEGSQYQLTQGNTTTYQIYAVLANVELRQISGSTSTFIGYYDSLKSVSQKLSDYGSGDFKVKILVSSLTETSGFEVWDINVILVSAVDTIVNFNLSNTGCCILLESEGGLTIGGTASGESGLITIKASNFTEIISCGQTMSDLVINNVNISDIDATNECSIIYAEYNNVIINGGTFNHNNINIIYNSGDDNEITINGGTFTNNTARIVAHQNGLGSLTITGGTFSQNDLTNETSAKSILYASYIRVVEGVTFSENKSPVFNLISGDILRIDNGTFTGNTNGVVISQGNIDIRGGTFSENTAESGAVINATAGHIAIVGGTFDSNSSVGDNTTGGGVIYLTGTATMEITAGSADTQPVFTNNTCKAMGGVIRNDSTGTFSDSTYGINTVLIKAGKFIGNKSNVNGGAISLMKGSMSLGVVSGSLKPLFDSNNAVRHGGAVAMATIAQLNVINGEFTNNTGKGFALFLKNTVTIGADAVIKNNVSTSNDGVQMSNDGNLIFNGGLVQGGIILNSTASNLYYISGSPSANSNIKLSVPTARINDYKTNKIVESTDSPWLYTSGMAGYSLVQGSNNNLYFAADSDIVAKVYLQSWGDRRINFTSLADAITYANSLTSSAGDMAVIDLQKDITISSQIAGLATQNKYIMLTSSKDVTVTISTSQPFAEFQGNLFVNSINGSITFTSSLSSIILFRMSNANSSLYIGSNIIFDGINGTCILLFAGKGYIQGATFKNCDGPILYLAPNTGNSSAEVGDIVVTNSTYDTYGLITVGSGCSLTMNNGEFSGNTAPNGIVNIGSGATATINGAIMSGNTCTSGAIVNAGTLTIGSGTFSGNTIDIAHRGTALNIDGDFEAKITVASGKDINVSSKLSSGNYTITPADYTAYPFDTTAIVNFTYDGVTAEEVATQKAYFVSADTNYSFVQGETNTTKLYLEKDITITFNVNDSVAGKVSPTTLTVPYNSTVSISNNILTINNQTVTATATTSTDSVKYAFASWSVANGTKITSSTTITANFTTQYKVTASVNTGDTTAKIAGDNGWTASGTSAYKWVNKGATIGTLPTGSRTGYTLAGFYTGATTGSQVSTSTVVSAEMTIYAYWTANSVKVTYDTNGGLFNYANFYSELDSGSTKNGLTYTFDSLTNVLTLNGTATSGAAFGSFNFGQTGVFKAGDVYTFKLEIISGTLPSGFVIVVDTARASGDSVAAIYNDSTTGAQRVNADLYATKLTGTITIQSGNSYLLANGQGFAFQTWFDSSNGATKVLNNVKLKVTLTKSGVSTQETYMKFNSKYSTTMTTPVKDGYTFAGWYSDSGLTKRVNRTDTMNSTSPVTLYAKWTTNTYHVTLNNSSATTAGTTDVYYKYRTSVNGKYYFSDAALTTALSGDIGTFITKPTKTGYIFAGYYTEQNGSGTQYVSAAGEFINSIYWNVANDITLYAHWTAIKPTVTINAASNTIVYGAGTVGLSSTVTPTDLTITYQWYRASSANFVCDSSTKIANATSATYNHPNYVNVGSYYYKLVVTSTANGTSATSNEVLITVTKATLTKPTISGTYTYTGSVQTVKLNNFNDALMTVSNNTATNAGTTTVKVALKDKTNYSWSDNTTTDLSLSWTIKKATLTVKADDKTMDYGGTAPTNSWSYVSGLLGNDTESVITGNASYKVTNSEGVEVEVNSSLSAGTYTIAVSGLSATNYDVTYQTGTLTVGKDTNPISLSQTTATIYVLASLDLSQYVKNAQGTVSYVVTSSTETTKGTLSGSKYTAGSLSTANDNDATVVITITAAGNSNYGASSPLTFTITVQKYIATLAWDSTTPSTMTYGQTGKVAKVNATVSGGTLGAIKYSSSATGVLTVAESTGALTTAGVGTATITATLAGTATVKAGSQTKQITVNANTSGTVVVTLDPTSYYYTGSAISATIKSVTLGGTAVTNYDVTGNSNTNVGEYTITVTINSGAYKGSTGTAKYTIVYPQVTLKGDSASSVTADQTIYPKYGTKDVYTASTGLTKANINIPTREGYKFLGWFDGDTQMINENGALVNNFTLTAPATWTQKWTAGDYTITYDLVGGTLPSGKTNPETYTIESATFTLINPTRTGYDFAGWTGTDLTEATKTVTIAKGSTGNRTYTANWTAVEYTITYELNDGSVTGNPDTYTVEDSFTLNNPTKAGYTFAGWTGTGLTEATETVTITKGSTGDRNYKANWTANSYNITLNADGGTGASISPSATYSTSTSVQTRTLKNPLKTGYTFQKWTVSGDNASAKVEGTTLTIPANSYGNITLTAVWTVNSQGLTVQAYSNSVKDANFTYDENAVGGTVQINSGTAGAHATAKVDFNNKATITAKANSHYKFVGWYKTDGTKVSDSASYEITMDATDVTYIARFEVITKTVTVNIPSNCSIVLATDDSTRDYSSVLDSSTQKETFTFKEGATPRFEVRPNKGYRVSQIKVTLSSSGSAVDTLPYSEITDDGVKTYKFDGELFENGLMDNYTLTATIVARAYTVTFDTNGGQVNFINMDAFTTSQVVGNTTATYDPLTQIITLDSAGNNATSVRFDAGFFNFGEVGHFKAGEKYIIKVEKVGGSFTCNYTWGLNSNTMITNSSGTYLTEGGGSSGSYNYGGGVLINENTHTFTLTVGGEGEKSAELYGSQLRFTLYISPNIELVLNNLQYKFTITKESSAQENVKVNYGSTYQYKLPAAVKEGYTFGGWYTDKNYTTRVTNASTFSSTSDITLYAKWTMDTYDVVLDKNDGSLVNLAAPCVAQDNSPLTIDFDTTTEVYTLNGTYSGNKWFKLASAKNLALVSGDVYLAKVQVISGGITSTVYSYPCFEFFPTKDGVNRTGNNYAGLYYGSLKTQGYKTIKVTISDTVASYSEIMIRIGYNGSNDSITFDNFKIKIAFYKGDTDDNVITPMAKEVNYGGTYGSLPTLSRDGYTFNGWYGYNNFDKSKYLLTSDYTAGGSYTYAAINLKPSTKYVVSIYRKNGYEGKNGYLLISASKSINSNWTAVSHLTQPNATSTNYVFTTGSDGNLYIDYNSLTQAGLDTVWASTDVVITEKTGDMTGGHYNSLTDRYETSYTPFIGTDEITSTTQVTTAANHKLQARWTLNNYTITYNADGGEDVATTNYTINDPITIPTTTKTGYTFAGWKVTTADGNWTADQIIAGGTTLTGKFGTVTLTAQWTANTYHVTLNNSSATTAGTTDVYYKYRTAVNYKYYFSDAALTTALSGDIGTFITKPTKTGYIFAGYYTEQNGSGTQYVSAEGEFINSIYWNVASDITLYANWTAKSVQVTVKNLSKTNNEGIVMGATTGTYTGTYKVGDTITLTNTSNGKYVFNKWVKGTDWSDNDIKETDGVYKYTITEADGEAGSITFSACYTVKVYLHAVSNGTVDDETGGQISFGTTFSKYAEAGLVYDNPIYAFNTHAKVKDGYTFGGWFTNAECTGSPVSTSLDYACPKGTNGTINLYAKFSSNVYTISYKDQGDSAYTGSNINDLPSTHTYGTATELIDGYKAGYTFGGWYLTSDCTGERVTSLGATDFLANITLYAKWNDAVCYIEETGAYYATLQEAVNAAVSGQTIRIIAESIVLSEPVHIGSSWNGTKTVENIPNAKTLTITTDVNTTITRSADFRQETWLSYNNYTSPMFYIAHKNSKITIVGDKANNKTITFDGQNQSMFNLIKATNSATLNLNENVIFTNDGKGTTATGWGGQSSAVLLRNYATLNLNGAIIQNSTNYGIWDQNGILYINSGKITNNGSEGVYITLGSKAYMTGGEISGQKVYNDVSVESYAYTNSSNGQEIYSPAVWTMTGGTIGVIYNTGRIVINDSSVKVNTIRLENKYVNSLSLNATLELNASPVIGTIEIRDGNTNASTKFSYILVNTKLANATAYNIQFATISAYADTTNKVVEFTTQDQVDLSKFKLTASGYALVSEGLNAYVRTNRTVTYNVNGGTPTIASETRYNGEVFNITSQAVTKTGYTFAGWNDGTTTYKSGASYTMPNSNVTFTAVWTADSFTIAFDGNNSTSGSMSSITATIGQSLTLPANTFVRAGYTFVHWCEEPNRVHARGWNGIHYEDNATLSADDILTLYTVAGKNGTYTLYAHWTAITYTITYNSNGGTDVGSQTYTITTDLTLTDETPTKTNYTFTGWKLATSVNNWQAGIYQTSQNVGTGKYGNITLVAQWNIITYKLDVSVGYDFVTNPYDLTLALEDGQELHLTQSNKTGTLSHTYDSVNTYTVTLALNNPTTRYFIALYLDGNSVASNYTDLSKTSISFEWSPVKDGKLLWYIREVFEITAQPTTGIDTVQINYSYADGNRTGTPSTTSIQQDVLYGFKHELVATVKQGYVFDGWYVNGSKVSSSLTYTVSSTVASVTYEARTTAIQSNVYFNNNDGSNVNLFNRDTFTIRENTAAFELVLEEGKTYTLTSNKPLQFVKISTGPNGYACGIDRRDVSSVTFKFERNSNIDAKYKLYLLLNTVSGATVEKSMFDGYEIKIEEGSTATAYSPEYKKVSYNGAYASLPTPTRAGYEFLGWFTDKTNGEQITDTSKVTITSEQTLYAHWKAKLKIIINVNIDSGCDDNIMLVIKVYNVKTKETYSYSVSKSTTIILSGLEPSLYMISFVAPSQHTALVDGKSSKISALIDTDIIWNVKLNKTSSGGFGGRDTVN